jgi:hypothetical protein
MDGAHSHRVRERLPEALRNTPRHAASANCK